MTPPACTGSADTGPALTVHAGCRPPTVAGVMIRSVPLKPVRSRLLRNVGQSLDGAALAGTAEARLAISAAPATHNAILCFLPAMCPRCHLPVATLCAKACLSSSFHGQFAQ